MEIAEEKRGPVALLALQGKLDAGTANKAWLAGNIWIHSLVAIALTGVVLAHIYIGTIGMQGAFEAMGNGEVDVNWARQHHSLWLEKEARKGRVPGGAAPAE